MAPPGQGYVKAWRLVALDLDFVFDAFDAFDAAGHAFGRLALRSLVDLAAQVDDAVARLHRDVQRAEIFLGDEGGLDFARDKRIRSVFAGRLRGRLRF